MRPELKEYNYDWMLYRTLDLGYRSTLGSMEEFKIMVKYTPYFQGILEPIVNEGEPGILFLELLKTYFDKIIHAHELGKKSVMTTFCFSTAILYAMDLIPVMAEPLSTLGILMHARGTSEYLDYCCQLGLTETSCSAQRGAIGAYLAGLGNKIDMVVLDSPGICDTNANAFAFISAYLGLPIYQLDFPPTLVDKNTSTYHVEDYKGLIRFLEEHSGNKLDVDRLREILSEMKKQDEITAELEDYHRLSPSPMPILYNLFIYAGRFFAVGLPEYTKMLQAMLKVVETNAENQISGLRSGGEKLRALFCYIDHFVINLDFWHWLESKGIAQVGSLLSRFWSSDSSYEGNLHLSAYKLDISSLDTMLDSLAAQNSRMPMVRSIRGPYDKPLMWLEETLGMAKMYNVDAIIYNGTPGCRNTWGMIKLLARDTEKHGYPTHIMYADAFDERVESWETSKMRLEEFFRVRKLFK